MTPAEDWDAFADWRAERAEAVGDILSERDHRDSGEADLLDRAADGYYDEDVSA